MSLRAKFLAGAVTGVLVLGLAACGGDDDDSGSSTTSDTSSDTDAPTDDTTADGSSEAYVAAVCTAVGDWSDTIQSDPALSQDPESKEDLIAGLEVLRDANADLVAAVQDAGTPDIDGGGEIADTLTTAATDFEQAVDTALTDAEALPDNFPQELVSAIGDALDAAFDAFDAVVSNPPASLQDVVDATPECEGVIG